MKKFFTLMIAPIMAVIMLAGCSSDNYKLADVNEKFNSYMDSYISGQSNVMFKNNLQPLASTSNEGDFIDGQRTYEKIMYLTYSTNNKLNEAIKGTHNVGNVDLNEDYKQLTGIYQQILSLTFNYYANWNTNFFSAIETLEKKPSQSEINDLYKKLEKLSDATNQANDARIDFEDDIKYFGSLTDVRVPLQLSKYKSKLNNLVQSSFDFVNYFKDLHKKYVFTSNAINSSYALRVVDDALLLVAETVFYDNVLAFDLNGKTDIAFLTIPSNTNKEFIMVNKPNWKNLVVNTDGAIYAKSNLNAIVLGTNLTVQQLIDGDESENGIKAREIVSQLNNYVNHFTSNLVKYKKIFDKVDVLNYNYYRKLTDAPLSFNFNALSTENKTNIKFLAEVANQNLPMLYYSLFNVIA